MATISALTLDIAAAGVRRGTPIAFAAMGETLCERGGVINLGVEGMMLVGAMTAVALQVNLGDPVLSVFAAGLAAAALAGIHAFLVLRMGANQIVSGIALTLFGTGLSGLLGRPLVGRKVEGIDTLTAPILRDLPVFGGQDLLTYISILTAIVAWLVVYRTKYGLWLRAVGENPEAAYAQGVPVRLTQAAAVVAGGFLAGVGGAHLAIAYTHVWAERMTAGQGWLAVGLVVVAGWHPMRSLLAAWLFGGLTVLHSQLQAAGIETQLYLLKMLPYLAAIFALALAVGVMRRRGYGIPAALGRSMLSGRTADVLD